jgi:TonB family protein
MANQKDDIEKYLRGQLSPAEMHALEMRALHDPFLAEALEGGTTLSQEDFSTDIKDLEDRINKRAISKQRPSQWIYRIAAAFLLLAASTFLIFQFFGHRNTESPITLNAQQEKESPIESVPDKDSLTSTETPQSAGSGTNKERVGQKPEKYVETPGDEEASVDAHPITRQSDIAESQEKDAGNEVADETPGSKAEAAFPIENRAAALTIPDTAMVETGSSRVKRKMTEKGETNPASVQRLATPDAVVQPKIIRGRVTDIDDGLPLPGITVTAEGTSTATVTDLNGRYELGVPGYPASFRFSAMGVQPRNIEVPSVGDSPAEVNVQMAPDVSQPSEVVVIGYGTESGSGVKGAKWVPAQPVGGNNELKKYLENNLQYPENAIENKVEGNVTVLFTIEPNGNLTDFRVVRSLGFGCDEELIRLIKDGPQWKPTTRDNEPVRGKGKVRLRFVLPR